jgi:hypothetical protein
VSEKQPLVFGWIGDCSAIKAFSFVPHANQYLPIHAAAAGDVNLFLLILVIAVNHRVGQSLLYGDFKFLFSCSRHACFSHEEPNESHESLYEWQDRSYTAGEGLL